jgi:dihydrodipicolinate synthase/N-acetylneuraminate lyase
MAKAYAAALTPLRDRGEALDLDAVPAYLEFLARAGLDGILALGTTGEGILLSVEERKLATDAFLGGRLPVIVHCGAQTTRDTVILAEHAAAAGAAGVAVIGPPYFTLDERAQLAHFLAAAEACAPTPFYVYEFRARAGWSIAASVLADLRQRASNLTGLKVSNRPFTDVEPYLVEGLDVFVGAEELVQQALARGAAGTVSGLASVYPEEVTALVRGEPSRAPELRAGLERFPFHAAAKLALARRGVSIEPDVRCPLRQLSQSERTELEEWLDASS